jgi:hypothetical protein
MNAKTAKNYKPQMMAAAIFAILIIGYFTKDKWMNFFTTGKIASSNGNSSSNNTSSSSTSSSSSSSTGIKKDLVLKKGDTNDSVKELQRILNLEHDYQTENSTAPPSLPKLSTDRVFGSKTEAMLNLFTSKNSITINQLNMQLLAQKSN